MGNKTPTFPLNAWYAAAWDAEVKRELLARTICNKKIVLYRTQDDRAVALEDACWHRLVPLSMGRLMEAKIKNSGLAVLEGAGHFSYADRYAQFCAVMRVFFKD